MTKIELIEYVDLDPGMTTSMVIVKETTVTPHWWRNRVSEEIVTYMRARGSWQLNGVTVTDTDKKRQLFDIALNRLSMRKLDEYITL